MHEDIYASITEWEHHPKVIVALAHLIPLAIILPTDNPFVAIVAAMLLAIPTTLIIFIPYLAIMLISALLLSLLQAIATAIRHPDRATHSSPIR